MSGLLGDRIGTYRIEREVAQRGPFVVYAAEHEVLGRRVLIKTLGAALPGDAREADELVAEAKILADLDHEGIASVFEVHRSPALTYVVLADPGGPPLQGLLEKSSNGVLALECAIAVAASIGAALGHAHERGALARQLRPETVWTTPSGGVKILELEAEATARSDEMAPPDYLSPEELHGEPRSVQSDVYVLAALLHRMIVGRPPPRPRPGVRPRFDDLPPHAVAILGRALAREPADRYDGMPAFVAELDALIGGPQARAAQVQRALAAARIITDLPTTTSAPKRARKDASVRPLALRLGALGVVTLASAIVFEWQRGLTEREAAEASQPAQLRVLAQPWADIYVDGKLVETTPIGRALPIPAGRHVVTLRHPSAPDEERRIEARPGQIIVIDVSMRVARDAGVPEAGPPIDEGP